MSWPPCEDDNQVPDRDRLSDSASESADLGGRLLVRLRDDPATLAADGPDGGPCPSSGTEGRGDGGVVASSPAPPSAPFRDPSPGELGAGGGQGGPVAKNWIVTTFASLHFPGGASEGEIYPVIGQAAINPGCLFFAGQEETCPSTSLVHGHFVVCLARPCKRGGVAKVFARAYDSLAVKPFGPRAAADWAAWLRRCHFEPVRDLDAAIDYVTKDDTRRRGPFSYGVRPRTGQVHSRVRLGPGLELDIKPVGREPLDARGLYVIRLGGGGLLAPVLWTDAEDSEDA